MRNRDVHPVIVGIGQITHRSKICNDEPSPTELARRAVEACVRDSECPGILRHVDHVSVVNMFCETENPSGPLCDMLGVHPSLREYSSIGGNTPQWFVNRAADSIAAGRTQMALLAGAEALYSENRTADPFRAYKALEGMSRRNEIVGSTRMGFADHERLHNAYGATRVYPLFENALRAERKQSIEEHRSFLSRYCAGFSKVAADNPLAWFREARSSREIGRVTAQNRMISFPYTKFMNPVMVVNQSAALILTSTNVAKKLSIPSDKWVYLLGGAEVAEKWLLSERINYTSSPAIREMTKASLNMAGLRVDQVDFFDLYSCFPSASIIAASEIGLNMNDLPALTITGGLPYFGGPGNNYTMHAIAHTVERIRAKPEQAGLVTGVGLYLTKHSLGIYGGREPEKPWNRDSLGDLQEKVDRQESPPLSLSPEGPAVVETYTVIHDRGNAPEYSVIIARLENGQRCFSQTDKDRDLLHSMETEEFVGKGGFIRHGNDAPNIMRF